MFIGIHLTIKDTPALKFLFGGHRFDTGIWN